VLTVLLLVDGSAWMRFGSNLLMMRVVAAELAALLAFSATKNSDRVGLAMFTDRVEHIVTPKKGKKHVLRLISDVLTYRPEHRGTRIDEALGWMSRIGRRKTICFVVSDFLAPPASFEKALSIVARRHDVVPIIVRDKIDRELPRLGLVLGEDLETGREVWIDTDSRGFRERYAAENERQKKRLGELLRKLKLDAIEVETGGSYTKALVQFFELRARRH
jgi:uncharacterized protein (DUF58 family)